MISCMSIRNERFIATVKIECEKATPPVDLRQEKHWLKVWSVVSLLDCGTRVSQLALSSKREIIFAINTETE